MNADPASGDDIRDELPHDLDASEFVGAYRFPAALYVLVWVADDSRESDGRPDVDGGAGPGRHLVRVRAMAIGRDGARRVVDAELVRICVATHPACEPGIRVQSERERRLALP